MDRVLKVLQIINQVVWIVVGLATLYSIYFFITHNPVDELLKRMPFGTVQEESTSSTQDSQLETQIKTNPQLQKMIQQYLQNSQ